MYPGAQAHTGAVPDVLHTSFVLHVREPQVTGPPPLLLLPQPAKSPMNTAAVSKFVLIGAPGGRSPTHFLDGPCPKYVRRHSRRLEANRLSNDRRLHVGIHHTVE